MNFKVSEYNLNYIKEYVAEVISEQEQYRDDFGYSSGYANGKSNGSSDLLYRLLGDAEAQKIWDEAALLAQQYKEVAEEYNGKYSFFGKSVLVTTCSWDHNKRALVNPDGGDATKYLSNAEFSTLVETHVLVQE